MTVPFQWIDPAMIPPLGWIYGRHYIRKFITETVAPSGLSLSIVEALAISTGRPLLGVVPKERVNVWLLGEDPMDELQRRLAAACLQYGIDPSEWEGHLSVDSGREQKIVIAEMADQVIDEIRANDFGVVIVENQLAASTWADIADATNCSINLVHHSRNALVAKARSVRVFNGMRADEAAKAGVDNHHSFFRMDNGEGNLEWRRFVSVDLGNGDEVDVVVPWEWPNAQTAKPAPNRRAKLTYPPVPGDRRC